jgi:hypothetical protein
VRANGGGGTKYFNVTATGTTIDGTYLQTSNSVTAFVIQAAASNNALVFDSTNKHLKIYEVTGSPTRYADIYYDNATSTAVFAASSGTTKVGSGSGNITMSLTNQADVFAFTKSGALSSSYNDNDFSITRSINGGSYQVSGNVLSVVDQTGTSGGVLPNLVYINQDSVSGVGGNLILAQTGGSTDKFKVDTSGNTTIAGTYAVGASNGSTISTCGANQYVASFASTGGIITGGSCTALPAGGTATLQDVYNNDSSGEADIATTSAAKTILFKAGATYDSATLFHVQDASSVDAFSVDTVNDRVQIGSATPDAVGTVLVLDTKNSAGDPATGAVDGAMYYNSSIGEFRCRVNSDWKNCSHPSLRQGWFFYEDFPNAGTATNTIGSNNWALTATSSGTVAKLASGAAASDYDRYGITRLGSATTAASGVAVYQYQSAMNGVPGDMVTEFNIASITDNLQMIVRIGLIGGTTTSTAPTDGIYFQYNVTTAAANWFRCTRNNGAETCTDTGIAKAAINTYERMKIVTNTAGTQVDFYINEVSAGSNTTNLPASGRSYGPGIFVHSPSTTARYWKMDYFQVRRTNVTR